MTSEGFTLFDTPLGRCGISWGPRGITGVQLPESSDAATRARLLRRLPDLPALPPPAEVQAAIADIVALLSGEARMFETVALDMSGVPPFHRRVYALTRAIAPGRTRSYGELARELGEPGAARAVGQALGANPFAPIVPCHRVLAAFQRQAAWRPSCACCRSKARALGPSRGCSTRRRLAEHGKAPMGRKPAGRGILAIFQSAGSSYDTQALQLFPGRAHCCRPAALRL